MATRHTITERELNEWLCRPQWHTFASSASGDGVKRLDIDVGTEEGPVLRVTDRGETVFLGTDKAAAVAAYNSAHCGSE